MNHKNLILSRLKFLLILFLFLGPLVAAFIWYYGFGANLAPKGQSNYSPLISPVVTIAQFNNDLYGQASDNSHAVNSDFLQKKWTMVHILSTPCTERCKQSLYNTRQTRIALGKDAHRVQRILVVPDSSFADEVALNHAKAAIVRIDENGIEKQLQDIISREKIGPDDAILIDPLGNAMMIISIELEPRLLLKDLKKLLKLSRIG